MKDIERINMDQEYANDHSTYYVTDLKYFSKYGIGIPNVYSNTTDYKLFNQNTVVIEFLDSDEKRPSKEQIKAFEFFILEEKKISVDVISSIYNYYKQSYNNYYKGASLFATSDDLSLIEDFLPKIVRGNELDGLIKLNYLLIHSPINGASRIGLEFSCSWDEEHGLGVLLENNTVIDTGFADVSYPY